MSQKFHRRRFGFLALAVVALCSWSGLIWFAHPHEQLWRRPIGEDVVQPLTFTASAPSHTPPPIVKETEIAEDGTLLVHVPAGEFLMGSDDSLDKQPIHKVRLGSFWISQTEVTNNSFASFVADTGYQTDAEKAGWSHVWDGMNWIPADGASWLHPDGAESDILGMEKHPVVQVSWNDANSYCKWAGMRLPTEAEWEKAARGTDGRIYPWGNDPPNKQLLNAQNPATGTTEVGSYPEGASPYGAYDMSGNVWEWVNDWYRYDYYGSLGDDAFNPPGPVSGSGRVLRGGSWLNYYDVVRAADRSHSNPLFSFRSYGFRCARSSK